MVCLEVLWGRGRVVRPEVGTSATVRRRGVLGGLLVQGLLNQQTVLQLCLHSECTHSSEDLSPSGLITSSLRWSASQDTGPHTPGTTSGHCVTPVASSGSCNYDYHSVEPSKMTWWDC